MATTATEIRVSAPEHHQSTPQTDDSAVADADASESADVVTPLEPKKPSLLTKFLDNLLKEKAGIDQDDDENIYEMMTFEVVDDNARMHRTQSYYRIELTYSTLLPNNSQVVEWRPQDPVVGSANNTKDRWGLVKKTNSSMSLGGGETITGNNNNGNNNNTTGSDYEQDLEYETLYPDQHHHHHHPPSNNTKNSELFLTKPHRRGSIDNMEFNVSPTGSTNTVEMALEIAAALTLQQQEKEKKKPSTSKKKKKKRTTTNTKSSSNKRDNDKEQRRKERKARKKKKKQQQQQKQEEHYQEQQQQQQVVVTKSDEPPPQNNKNDQDEEKKDDVLKATRERRNPPKWDALLTRSERSFGQTGQTTTTTTTTTTPASKRKSAPSVFSPMCKSMALPSQPSRTFSPPYIPRTFTDFDDDEDDDEHQANGAGATGTMSILAPDLLHDDDDDDDGYDGDAAANIATSDTETTNNLLLDDDGVEGTADDAKATTTATTSTSTTTEKRISAASYDAIYEMKQQRPPVPATSDDEDDLEEEEDDYEEEESNVELSSADEFEIPLLPPARGDNNDTTDDDFSSSSEYEIPLPPIEDDSDAHLQPVVTTTTFAERDNGIMSDDSNRIMMDASHRSEKTVDSAMSASEFQRKPPTHTNSFELTHRRSAVRHSMKRRVVKMTPQDLQSRIMDIQLTDEQQQQLQQLGQQQQQGDKLLDNQEDEEQDADGVPIHPPTLCDNDYTSSAEDEDFY